MKRFAKRSAIAVGVLGASALVVGCPDPDPPPPGCETNKTEYQLSVKDDRWCAGSGQEVTPEGYCECPASGEQYDSQSGNCVACSPRSCSGRTCGSDGCDGNCGRCPGGTTCQDGQCKACTGSCGGRSCGDDGCGRPCGICSDREICDEGECIPKDTSSVVTACNCEPRPMGARSGAWRPDHTCPSGLAQFEECRTSCEDRSRQWREICFELPTGALIVPCNCGMPPPGAVDGRRVDAPMCRGKAARVLVCRNAFGYPLPCSPFTAAWTATCDEC